MSSSRRPMVSTPRSYRTLLHASLVAGLLVCASGCDSYRTPVTPSTTQAATAEGIAITGGVSVLRTGYFADYTVTATMSDHTTQVVTNQAVLTTSDARVATIDANGRVNAFSNGIVTVNASYQGQKASRNLNIVSDFAGQWLGTYVVRVCDASGIFDTKHYCVNPGLWAPQRFSLDLKQSGDSLDQISGLMSLQNLPGSVAGRVTSDGKLVLTGSYVANGNGGTFGIGLAAWLTEPSAMVGMSGSFTYDLTVAGEEGRVRLHNEIITATKNVGSALPSASVWTSLPTASVQTDSLRPPTDSGVSLSSH